MPKARSEGAPASAGAVQRAAMRPALGLDELLELLVQHQLLDESQAREVASRATTLRSSVLKERVGSVRSQAAARYDVSPAEIVAAAHFPNPDPKQGKIDENAIAKVLAAAAGAPYLKIDPLKVDNDLVAKTLSRPFARRHVVIPVARERRRDRARGHRPVRHRAARLARAADPGAAALRRRRRSATSSRSSTASTASARRCSQAQAAARRAARPAARSCSWCELRSNAELAATSNDEHVDRRGRLPAQLRLRAARLGHPPRAARQGRGDPLPHRRHPARHRDGAAAPCTARSPRAIKVLAGMNIAERRRPQDGRIKTHARRARGGAARVEHGDRVRREGRRARVRPERADDQPPGPRLHRRRARALREVDHLPERADPRHGPDRLRQDHHALLDAPLPLGPRAQHHHGRGPDRDGRLALLPGAGATRRSTSRSRTRCARSCARTPTSSWSARSATPRPRNMAVQAALTGHLVFSTRAHAQRGRRGHAPGRARRRAASCSRACCAAWSRSG